MESEMEFSGENLDGSLGVLAGDTEEADCRGSWVFPRKVGNDGEILGWFMWTRYE